MPQEKYSWRPGEGVRSVSEVFVHIAGANFLFPTFIGVSDADLDKPTKLFGRSTTTREVLLVMATHMHEHLGQSIAYARVNGVVPPWSAKE